MAIIDIFTYNGEADILELHLDMTYPHVDKFIIVESPETFNGTPKPLYYQEQKDRFVKYADKIEYYIVSKEEDYPNDQALLAIADASPNVPKGVEHWRREFYKKELLKNALKGLQDDDICIIGDVDEILKPEVIAGFNSDLVLKYRIWVYTYWINNASDEVFYGPIISKYKNVKDGVLNHLRQFDHTKVEEYSGWHFTNMGGYDEIVKKVMSSYDEWEYDLYKKLLAYRMMRNIDYIGRDYKLGKDESNWPEYLKDNKEQYKHLIKT